MTRIPRGYQAALAAPLLQANAALVASVADRQGAARAVAASRQREADLEALWERARHDGPGLAGQPFDPLRCTAVLHFLAMLERRRGDAAEHSRLCAQRHDGAVQQCLLQQRRIEGIEDLDRRDRRAFAAAARRKVERDVGERWTAREGRHKEQRR